MGWLVIVSVSPCEGEEQMGLLDGPLAGKGLADVATRTWTRAVLFFQAVARGEKSRSLITGYQGRFYSGSVGASVIPGINGGSVEIASGHLSERKKR